MKILTKMRAGLVLPAMLVGALGVAAQTPAPKKAGDVPKEQREAIERIVYDYLLNNPAVVRQALENLQAQEEKAKADAVAKNLLNLRPELYRNAASPVLGSADENVPVVVFFDYFCGYCRKTVPALQELVAKDSSIRIVYKELPILGPHSVTAARAALAAGKQGAFAKFHIALFDAPGVGEPEIRAIAAKLGLDADRLLKDMGSPEITAELERNARLAESLNIGGTPAYVVGEQIVPGAIGTDALARIVTSEREKTAKNNNAATGPTALK